MARIRLHPPPSPEGRPGAGLGDFPASPVESVLVAALKAGFRLRHDCGGKALCGTCRVALEGDDARGPSPMEARERERLAAVGAPLDGSVRLACQLRSARDLELRAILPDA